MDDYRRYRSSASSTGNTGSYASSRGNASYGSQAGSTYSASSVGDQSAPSNSSKTRFNPFEESGRGGGGGGSARGSYGRSYAAKGGKRFDQDDYGDNDGEEDVEGIKKQIGSVKQDTLESTRNAMQKLKETEGVAENTLGTLGRQGEQIINVERQLDMADMHADRASDKTDELKRLNRSIFRPSFGNPFASKKRYDKELERKQAEHRAHMDKQAGLHAASRQTQQRVDAAVSGKGDSGLGSARGRYGDESGRYTFEDEDPQVEHEINENLDAISDSMARLKMMGTTMRDEITNQNERLKVVEGKTTNTHEKINYQKNRLDKIR